MSFVSYIFSIIFSVNLVCGGSAPDPCQRKKFFVRLNAVCDKFTVAKQSICSDRCRYIPGSFFVGDMNGFQRNAILLRSLLYLRYPIICKRALVGIVKDKSVPVRLRMSGAFLELRRFGIRYKRKVHEIYPAVGYVCRLKAFVCKKLRVGKKFALPTLGAENANTLLSLRHRVTDALGKKII